MMNTKPNHTRLPWWVAYGQIWAGDGIDKQISIAKPDRDEPRTSPTERDANADLICRAVNAHDDLLAALEKSIEVMKLAADRADNRTESGVISARIVNARAALAKAKGEAP